MEDLMAVTADNETPRTPVRGLSNTRTGRIAVEIVEGHGGIMPDIEREWNECLERTPEHERLFGYHWIRGWLQHLGNAGEWTGDVRILLARDIDGRVVGIVPLAKRRYHGLAFWALAGYYQPHRGIVCVHDRQDEICAALAQALLDMQGWNEVLRFGPYDTAVAERLLLVGELARRCRRLVCFDQERTIVARNIPSSPEEYRSLIHGHASMKRVLSYERRMQREGEASIRHHRNPSGDELRQMIEDCAAIESRSWLTNTEEGRPRFISQESRRFWEHVCAHQLGPQGQLNVWLAHFNGEPVAFRFTITTGSIRYMIANQYDQRYERFRLGWILYLRDLEDCAQHGVRTMDLGNGNLKYKSRWGGEEETMSQVIVVWPPGPLGILAAGLAKVGPVHRRMRRRI
jgi:CelD/BcsL family acetyltransferase involved in cellulose biosynthesis